MNLPTLAFPPEPASIVRLCLALCCTGAVISTLEFFRVLPAFRTTGVYSWPVIRCEQMRRIGLSSFIGRADLLGPPSSVAWLLGIRIIGLLTLPVLPLQTPAFALVAAVTCLVTGLFTWRRFIGDDGSDQMTTIVLVTFALSAGFGRGETALALGLWFLAFQACLSYVAAGVAKACSPEWRGGSAIFKVFNTEAYGLRPVAGFFRAYPKFGTLTAWGVIAGECLFPLVLLVPPAGLISVLAAGVLFHLLCAVIMGLNSFLWAFAATYPALVFANHSVRDAFGLGG